MKYRVFTNDVGPNQYSALQDVTAVTLEEAFKKTATLGLRKGTKFLCIPLSDIELLPHGVTGRAPEAAVKKFGGIIG